MDTTNNKKDRKPSDVPPESLEPAQSKLNRFLTENNILIGTERPQIDFTGNGQMIISAPKVFAVYKNQIAKDASKEVN